MKWAIGNEQVYVTRASIAMSTETVFRMKNTVYVGSVSRRILENELKY